MAENATVMIVDDEEMVAMSLRSFLELETSYRVLTFTSPDDALAALDDRPVHVVLADFYMPDMDGITFLKEVRRRRPRATRILLTGYADKENAIRAINEAGLYYYLEKPWDNDHLKLVVKNGVERSSLFTELSEQVGALEASQNQLEKILHLLAQALS